ncbi:hypothetical protein ABPG74_011566 [Tetrahymena malaccensis]
MFILCLYGYNQPQMQDFDHQGSSQMQMPQANKPQQANILISPPPAQSSYEDQVNYYQQEACRLYIANVVLTNQVKELLQEKNDLLQKYQKLEKRQLDTQQSLAEEKKKRHRRAAHEIERHYKCPQETCQKSYGSEGSLAQHIKLKHPDFFQIISANISQTLQAMRVDQPLDSKAEYTDYDEEDESDTSSKGKQKQKDSKEK